MATPTNDKPPRVTKRTATATVRAPRAGKNPSAENTSAQNAVTAATEQPVSTPQATVATARNTVIEGNATIDLDAVRRRAYELYEQRGRLDGFHEQDWYSAEQELRGRKQSRSQNGAPGADSKRRDSQRSA
jgi:hypothetical protein